MWGFNENHIDSSVTQYLLTEAHEPVSIQQALTLLRDDETFRQCFILFLKTLPFKHYRFETPPITTANLNDDFEFAIIDAPEINLSPDYSDFMNQFESTIDPVIEFNNLGNDAILIVPAPSNPTLNYAHLSAFTKNASLEQQDALWQCVGKATLNRINLSPVWLNTAGGGVPWLHVRLDNRPKYYQYQPYRYSE